MNSFLFDDTHEHDSSLLGVEVWDQASLETPLLNIKAHLLDESLEKGDDVGVHETNLVVVETVVECMVVDTNKGGEV